jgi:DNA-directed RNA polymerase subunit RPC12/RpoP
MLLDINDPTNVLARSKKPILEPKASYENDGWKSGVVYPCGAAIVKDRLYVYYGGADTVVCVASAKLDDFLKELVTNHKISDQKKAAIRAAARTLKKPGKVTGYCFKCRKNRLIKDAGYVELKSKRNAVAGTCPQCGSRIMKFVKIEKTRGK